LPQFPTSAPSAGFQLNPMKHKIVIEIPPYYIDTLVPPTQPLNLSSQHRKHLSRRLYFASLLPELMLRESFWPKMKDFLSFLNFFC
jgi:hypothetical protein